MNRNILLAALLAGVIFVSGCTSGPAKDYAAFASCVKDAGVVEYGAYWCPNCQRQKLMFGNSYKYINYVECDINDPAGKGQPEVCKAQGITGYPTWILDGKQYVGVQTFQQLAQATSCPL